MHSLCKSFWGKQCTVQSNKYRADSRFVPSQWETALLCNDVSHWLGTSLESALKYAHGSQFIFHWCKLPIELPIIFRITSLALGLCINPNRYGQITQIYQELVCNNNAAQHNKNVYILWDILYLISRSITPALTHWGLIAPYGIMIMGLHWFK